MPRRGGGRPSPRLRSRGACSFSCGTSGRIVADGTILGMIRAFVAVPVEDPVVRRRLAGAHSLLPPLRGVRWIPESQLHFTVKFLGEIGADRVTAAKAATAAAAARAAGGARLALEGLGAFPPRGPARVLWAGCGEGAEALTSIGAAVEAAFEAEGFPGRSAPSPPPDAGAREGPRRREAPDAGPADDPAGAVRRGPGLQPGSLPERPDAPRSRVHGASPRGDENPLLHRNRGPFRAETRRDR